jgi:hypothetical protein
MIIGTDAHLALELTKQRGAEMRAEAERHRLIRWLRVRGARGRPTRARPEEVYPEPGHRVYPRPERAAAR